MWEMSDSPWASSPILRSTQALLRPPTFSPLAAPPAELTDATDTADPYNALWSTHKDRTSLGYVMTKHGRINIFLGQDHSDVLPICMQITTNTP